MALNALPPWLDRQLRTLLQGRGHAWLLRGPSGLGQYPLALALAQSWLCLQPDADGVACGTCASCHSLSVRTHPDLCMLMPEAMALDLGWPVEDGALRDIEAKKRKPSQQVRVGAAREMVSFTQFTRSGGDRRVVCIYPADRMNAEAANTILKSLEEPPGETRFVLASDTTHGLLPTIRSRCQVHALQWPALADAVPWLVAQGVPAADAPVLLQAMGGRPDDALRAHAEGLQANHWRAVPKAIVQGQFEALADWQGGALVELLQKLCHDLFAVGQGQAPRFFAREDLPAAPITPALSAWSRELLELARSADHPFKPDLMREALLVRAQAAMRTP